MIFRYPAFFEIAATGKGQPAGPAGSFQEQDRSTIPACRSRQHRFRNLACGALLLAAAALGGAVGTAAAQSFQPPIANLTVYHRPIEQMSASGAQFQLDRIIDNNLTALRYYDDEGLCRIFRVFTQTEALNATEDLLNSLARQINRWDPQAGRRAAAEVANYVRRVSVLIRGTKCPPDRDFEAGTGRTVGSTVPRQARSAREQRSIDSLKRQIARMERRARRYLAAGNCRAYQEAREALEHRFTTEELAAAARGALASLPANCDPDAFIRSQLERDGNSTEAGGGEDAN
jgi:hypothetical protein